MNERQAYLAIRNAIRLENFSDDIARKIAPELRAIFNELGEQFRTMPPGNIERELWYRQQRLRIADMLAPLSREMGQELGARLGEEAAEQMQYAERYLKAAGEDPANLVAAAAPQDGLSVGFDGEGASFGRPQFTRTQLNAITQDVRVMGERLEDLFEPTIGRGEVGPWIRQNLNMIDRKVKAGFLTGQTSDQIAAQLPGFGAEAIRRNKAIARTAVMDLSAKANEEFWQANSDVIVGWEYDASLDNRVCEQCAPWDGEFKEQRNSLPAVPLHINCRCRVLPLTNAEMELRKEEGPQRRSVVELIEAPSKEQAIALAKAKPGVVAARAYAGQVKVNGKKYWRVAKDIQRKDGPLTMGEFLKQASPQTQLQVLGSKKRVSRFMGLVGGRDGSVPLSPDLALKRVVEWKPTVSRKPRMSAQMKLDISQLKSQKEEMRRVTRGDNFGVYSYLREDGTPYYIGKMRDERRAFSRQHNVKPPRDPRRIRLMRGGLTEQQAFDWERKYIARYGRKDAGTGILRNLTDGGEGASGLVMPKAAREALSRSARARLATPGALDRQRQFALQARDVQLSRKAAELGISVDRYTAMTPKERAALGAMGKRGTRYGFSPSEWISLTPEQRQEYGRLARTKPHAPDSLKRQEAARRHGMTLDQWNSLTRSEQLTANKRLRQGVEKPKLLGDMSDKVMRETAAKYEIPFSKWESMSPRDRNIVAQRFAKGLRGDALTDSRNQTMLASAQKYRIPYEKWAALSREQRARVKDRYRRGKRGAALLEGLL